MAHDDDKLENGDDPWAGLESEGLPELDAGFSFSFEEELVEGETGDAVGPAASAAAEAAAESAAEAAAESAADGAIDAAAEADAEIGDWLGEAADGDAAASSVLGAGAFSEDEDAAGELPDFLAGESSVNIGTGTSGILSPSGIDVADDDEPAAPALDADPFAGLTAEPMDWGTAVSDGDQIDGDSPERDSQDESVVAFDMAAATGLAGAAGAVAFAAGEDDPKPTAGKPKRPAPPRKKKPSVIGQLIGVVLGGALAIPITFAILIWGFGKDPFNLTPMLPESMAFLLPAKFQPAGAAAGLPQLPSLDDIVGTSGGGESADPGDASLPSGDDPVAIEPEPAATDLAAIDPVPPAGDPAADPLPVADPLMDLIDEPVLAVPPPAVVEPAAAPEPEPLDLEKLGAAIADAEAAFEAVTAVDDPSDPVRRRLLAKWYRALAGYAEELAAVERLAAETGRPFDAAVEQGEAIRAGLADHPQLLAELSRLTRDWIAYAKRPSDGVVAPATFVMARRVGPYWRSQLSLAATDKLPARELVVLTRAEPAVAPGDEVVIVGLAVDDDVVWASDLRPAAAGAGFPGL
jgi:hypothetical protein